MSREPKAGLLPGATLALSCVGLALAIVVAAGLLIRHLYYSTIAETQQNLTSLSIILADQTDRALQAIELAQRTILDDIVSDGIQDEAAFVTHMSKRALHETMRMRIAALPQVTALSVIDNSGNMISHTLQWPTPSINVADREYFREIAADPTIRTLTSAALFSRSEGKWTILIVQRITAPDGRFLGLLLGSVDLRYLETFYASIAPGPDVTIALFRSGGTLLARHPARPDLIGQRFPTSAAATLERADVPGGVLRKVSPIDGQDRLVAAAALSDFPLIVSISRTTAGSLVLWRQQAVALATAAAMLECGLIGVFALCTRQLRSRERLARAETAHLAAEERARNKRILLDQYVRFGTALDNMSQGLCMFGPDALLVVMNERFARMYQVPASLREPGTPLSGLAAYLADQVGMNIRDPRSNPDWATLTDAAQPEKLLATRDLADGRSINIAHAKTPDGGWICTHEDATVRKAQAAEIAFLARHDVLTGLSNRVRLREFMDNVLASPERGSSMAVLCLDLDGFKAINDTLGHSAGDTALEIVAQRLREHTSGGDLAARLGGDEFALVQVDQRQPEASLALAERLVAAMRQPIDVGGQEVVIGTSIGIALVGAIARDADEVLRSADIALYAAKAAGRGTWRLFEPCMDEALQRRRVLETDLRRAHAEGQFEVFYHPLVEADTQLVRGCEALLRWNHPTRGLIRPGEFIPLAEETGLIRPIGEWVLNQACAAASSWPDPVRVAINLSPVQFTQGDLAKQVEHALAASNLAPERLELEITESVLLADNEATLALLYRLRRLGVRIAMDDFGTGYSSLSYLRRFPFDKIKLDQSFVRNLEHDPDGLEIVRAMVGLGKALNMDVLAEGVETPTQLRILRNEGCDELQGFLFCKPMPLPELRRYIDARCCEPAEASLDLVAE